MCILWISTAFISVRYCFVWVWEGHTNEFFQAATKTRTRTQTSDRGVWCQSAERNVVGVCVYTTTVYMLRSICTYVFCKAACINGMAKLAFEKNTYLLRPCARALTTCLSSWGGVLSAELTICITCPAKLPHSFVHGGLKRGISD